jgi:hypothetical protein
VLGVPPFVSRAYAIAPLVVAAIAQTCASVIGLFSHGGDGVESLLRLQVEMLRQIEAELGAIQQGIQQILSRLDEIKDLIGALPKEVVVEFNRTAIAGLNLRYSEISEEFQKGGMTPELHEDLSNQLIPQIRTARDNLMSYPQPQFSLVPMICSALFVECYGMALLNTNSIRTTIALARYRRWFLSVSRGTTDSSLQGRIKALQHVQFADARAALSASASPPTTMCFTSGYDEYARRFEKKCTSDVMSTAVTPIQDDAVAKTAAKMIRRHILQSDEQPRVVTISPNHVGTFEQFYGPGPTYAPESRPDKCPASGHTTPCTAIENAAAANAADLTNRLTTNGLQLISLHALRDAAEHAIAFIDRLDGSPKKAT